MATDQEIRDAGLKYIPQQQYLQNPFELPVEPESPVVNQGIVNTNAFTGGGGDDFSVYNPDPNSIVNRNYQPNYDYRRFSEPDQSMVEMGRNQDYFYQPPSKMEGLMNLIPYAGSFVRGAKFLGNQISPYLPVNRRAILENELGGQGILVNNIGQIVQGQGDYNTAENIMAGYNANKITQKTIDKRQGTIEKTLADKYEMSPTDIAAVKAGTYTGPVKTDLIDRYSALDKFGNTLDSTNTLTDKIYDFEEDEKEKKKKDTIVGRYITKRNEKKAAKAAKDAEIAAAASRAESARQYNPAVHGATNYGLGSDGQQSYSGDAVGAPGLGFGVAAGGYGGPVSNRTGKGRTGYFYGGLASIL